MSDEEALVHSLTRDVVQQLCRAGYLPEACTPTGVLTQLVYSTPRQSKYYYYGINGLAGQYTTTPLIIE